MEPKGVQSVPAKSANNVFAVMMYKLREDHLAEYTEVQMINRFSFEGTTICDCECLNVLSSSNI